MDVHAANESKWYAVRICRLGKPPDATYILAGAHEWLTNITDKTAENDLVLLVDALDVWFQVSPKTLIERFEELGTRGVVVGAEINCCCWPYEFESVKSVSS
jgi:hypothetical protein